MYRPKKPVTVASSSSGRAVLGPVNGSGVVFGAFALEPVIVTANEIALSGPAAVRPSTWIV
jgi:hypothetical protein